MSTHRRPLAEAIETRHDFGAVSEVAISAGKCRGAFGSWCDVGDVNTVIPLPL